MKIIPITQAEANDFINTHHRHHKAVRGWKFGVALEHQSVTIGVMIVGRPVSRRQDDGKTLEVTRLCVTPDAPKNACSKLYGIAYRVARELGYTRIITYTLDSEHGHSLKASGWTNLGIRRAGSWSVPSRPRTDKHPTTPKQLWIKEMVQ